MFRKTLFAAAAVGSLLAVPALAQDGMTPPSSVPAQPAPGQTATPPAPSGSLQLQPGAPVTGSDGAALGALEGVRTTDAGEQELTVRGADGQLRGVPLAGLRPEGTGVVVGWTAAEFQAAPTIAGDAPAASPPADPMTPPTSPDETTEEPTEPQG